MNNKVAIVTGGCSGLGISITEQLLAEGCQVVIGDIAFTDAARNWLEELVEKGKQVCFVKTDVSVRDNTEFLFDETLRLFDSVDILVNNAGIWPTAYVRDMKEEDFRRTLDINLIGPFMLSQRTTWR